MRKYATIYTVLALGGLLCADALSAPQEQRFLLESHGLPVTGLKDGKPYIETSPVLVKFDTATGRIWRYVCVKSLQDDKTQRIISESFVLIPVEGLSEDKADQPGRFRIMDTSLIAEITSGGSLKSYQGSRDVLVLDGVSGRAWAYRGDRQEKDGKMTLRESFVLIKDSDKQP